MNKLEFHPFISKLIFQRYVPYPGAEIRTQPKPFVVDNGKLIISGANADHIYRIDISNINAANLNKKPISKDFRFCNRLQDNWFYKSCSIDDRIIFNIDNDGVIISYDIHRGKNIIENIPSYTIEDTDGLHKGEVYGEGRRKIYKKVYEGYEQRNHPFSVLDFVEKLFVHKPENYFIQRISGTSLKAMKKLKLNEFNLEPERITIGAKGSAAMLTTELDTPTNMYANFKSNSFEEILKINPQMPFDLIIFSDENEALFKKDGSIILLKQTGFPYAEIAVSTFTDSAITKDDYDKLGIIGQKIKN